VAFEPDDIRVVENAIQLALGPSFLLAAAISGLAAFITRLARLNDRLAALEAGAAARPGELALLHRRAFYTHGAILASVASAILVAASLALAFFAALFGVVYGGHILAALVLLAMLALIAALALFFLEIRLAVSRPD
jgi:hypothetical protein